MKGLKKSIGKDYFKTLMHTADARDICNPFRLTPRNYGRIVIESAGYEYRSFEVMFSSIQFHNRTVAAAEVGQPFPANHPRPSSTPQSDTCTFILSE